MQQISKVQWTLRESTRQIKHWTEANDKPPAAVSTETDTRSLCRDTSTPVDEPEGFDGMEDGTA